MGEWPPAPCLSMGYAGFGCSMRPGVGWQLTFFGVRLVIAGTAYAKSSLTIAIKKRHDCTHIHRRDRVQPYRVDRDCEANDRRSEDLWCQYRQIPKAMPSRASDFGAV